MLAERDHRRRGVARDRHIETGKLGKARESVQHRIAVAEQALRRLLHTARQEVLPQGLNDPVAFVRSADPQRIVENGTQIDILVDERPSRQQRDAVLQLDDPLLQCVGRVEHTEERTGGPRHSGEPAHATGSRCTDRFER